jgi:glucosylceramidase
MWILLVLFIHLGFVHSQNDEVEFWLTTTSKNILLKRQGNLILSNSNKIIPDIEIFKSEKLQVIEGFGWCLTGGSAELINSLPLNTKSELLLGIIKK